MDIFLKIYFIDDDVNRGVGVLCLVLQLQDFDLNCAECPHPSNASSDSEVQCSVKWTSENGNSIPDKNKKKIL